MEVGFGFGISEGARKMKYAAQKLNAKRTARAIKRIESKSSIENETADRLKRALIENQALRDVIKNFLGILDTPLGRMKFQSQFVKEVIDQAKKL